MPLPLRILLAVFSGLAGVGAIYLIQKPGNPSIEQALELAAVTLLLASVLLNTVWDAARGGQAPDAADPLILSAGPPLPVSGPLVADDPVQGEVARIISLLRSHAEANAHFSTVLERARSELHESLKAEQVRVIISYLMIENEKMRAHTSNLRGNLEQSQRQIETLKSSLATVEAQGLSDPLTGLRNRRGFDMVLASQVAAARHAGLPLSLVIVDIDHFKAINDRYGHPAGDDVLRWFSRILSGSVKGRDTVARYGGEEFAVLLPQTALDNATLVAAQIKAQLERQLWQKPDAPGTVLRVTASFGVAQLAAAEGTSALIGRADAKLYEAKSGGRNRVAA